MKRYKIIPIISWSVVAVVLIGIMAYLRINGPKAFFALPAPETGTRLLNRSYDGSRIKKISIDSKSADIRFGASDTDRIEVICTGTPDRGGQPRITASDDGSTLKIQQQPEPFYFFPFAWNHWTRIEVKFPKAYSRDIAIQNTSGDVEFDGDYKLDDFSISQTSGGFKAGRITARTFSGIASSGDADIASLSAEKYEIRTTSGSLEIGELSGAGMLQTTSGDISAHIAKMTGDVTIGAVSGTVDLSFSEGVSAAVTAECTSGNISANFPLNYAERHRNRATGRIGTEAPKALSISTTSGDINMNVQSNSSSLLPSGTGRKMWCPPSCVLTFPAGSRT